MSFLEQLDSLYQVIVVDMASTRGALRKLLYRMADYIVLLVSNDPASLYASVDKVGRIRAGMNPTSKLLVVENAPIKGGVSSTDLRAEFERIAQLDEHEWGGSIPFCGAGRRWPGSGTTLYGMGSSALKSALTHVAENLGLISSAQRSLGAALASRVGQLFRREGRVGAVDTQTRTLPAHTVPGAETPKALSAPPTLQLAEPTKTDLPESQEPLVRPAKVRSFRSTNGERASETEERDKDLLADPRRLVSGVTLSGRK